MLRPLILALSRSRSAGALATHAPGLRRISRRFVAGTKQPDALAAVRKLNDAGFSATVSFLGEEVTDVAAVDAAVREYTSFIDAVAAQGLRSHCSVKLSELGLAFDATLAARSLETVLLAGERGNVFVRVDMEDSRYTQATLDIVREAHTRHPGVGVVVQAYLRRSEDDIRALAREGIGVRLVKGAYREPPDVAYEGKADVDAAMIRLVLAYVEEVTGDARLAVATHDARIIRMAARAAHDLPRGRFEFQLLYGIRADLQRALFARGYDVRIYVPYGDQWYPYLMRRLAERPANVWFLLRNAFR